MKNLRGFLKSNFIFTVLLFLKKLFFGILNKTFLEFLHQISELFLLKRKILEKKLFILIFKIFFYLVILLIISHTSCQILPFLSYLYLIFGNFLIFIILLYFH